MPDDDGEYQCAVCIRNQIKCLETQRKGIEVLFEQVLVERNTEREKVAEYEKSLGLIAEPGKDIEVGYRDLENLARDALGKFR